MDSKKIITLLVSLFGLAGLTACNSKGMGSKEQQDVIGSPLSKISKLYSLSSDSSNEVALFDSNVKKIHIFDLASMTYKRSYSPSSPEEKHTVIHHPSGQYTIDLAAKNLTVFSKNMEPQNPITFEGNPISGAFNSEKNILVIYDDTNAVIILKFSDSGSVLKVYPGGPQLGANDSIKAGDLLKDGNLVLALSNRKIVTIDTEKTLAQNNWTKVSEVTPNMPKPMSWIAPLRDSATQMAYYSEGRFGIIDTDSGTIIAEEDVASKYVDILSKGIDPHLISKEDSTGRTLIFYAANSAIVKKELSKNTPTVADSFLDIQNSIWNFVDSGSFKYDSGANKYVYSDRTLKSYRLDDMLVKSVIKIQNQSEIAFTKDYLLSLFPSDLGYATSTNIETKAIKEAKFFNNGVVK